MFDNVSFPTFAGIPKIFIFDCCRGGNQESKIPQENERGSVWKESIVSKDYRTKITNRSSMCLWYREFHFS